MESKVISTQTSINQHSEFDQTSQNLFSNDILPILDHLSQLYLPFQSIEFIQIIFCFFQSFQSSFWYANGKYWKEPKIANIFHYIAYFSSINQNNKEEFILFGVLLSIVFIISVLFLIIIIHYRKTRRINRPILYIIRSYYMIIGGVILHPLSSLTGNLFIRCIDETTISNIFLLIFSTIGFILAECTFLLNQIFINQSIYIHKSLLATFNSTLVIFIFICSPSFLLLSRLFHYYPYWSFYFLIFFHISFIIASFIKCIWMSFILDLANVLTVSILSSIIFNDLFRIFVENYHQIRQEIFISISFLVFFVLFFIFYFLCKFYRKRIDLALSYTNLENPEKDETNQIEIIIEEKYLYFNELKLGQNMKKAMIYLIVGFSSGSDMFIDFSLANYCMEKYKNSPQMTILLAQLLSYFKKAENRFENALLNYRSIRDDSFFGQFLYYQAHRIKIFRQVISTNSSSNRLNELRLQSIDLGNQIKNFWNLTTANSNTLENLEHKQRELNNLWDESIEDNWSSVSYREEHIRFLIESCTSYQKAVQMTNIKDKIDYLIKDRDDLCYISLLLCFPKYFKNKIIDKKGNSLFQKNAKNPTDTSSISGQNEKTSNSSTEYDYTFDEQIANSIMSNGRLRLAMQNALSQAKPSMDKVIIIYCVFSILCSFIVAITTFVIYYNSFDSFDDWNRRVGVLVDLRIAYNKAFLSLSVFFGKKTNRFTLDKFDCYTIDDLNKYFLDELTNFNELALYYVKEARSQFSDLMEAILEISLERDEIKTISSLLFDQSINSTLCYFNQIIEYANWSMEQELNFEILSFAILAEDDDEVADWIDNNTFWCHNINTIPNVENMFTKIQNTLAYDLSNSSTNTSKKTLIEIYTIGPILFIIFAFTLPFLLHSYSKEINHLIKMMLATDQEFKEQAKMNISLSRSNETNDVISTNAKVSLNWKILMLSVLNIIIFCSFIVFEELILFYSKRMSDKLIYYGFWNTNFALLRSYMIEILVEIVNAAYFSNTSYEYISTQKFKRRIYEILDAYERNVYEIMNDTPSSPSSMDKDSFVDSLISSQLCENSGPIKNLHDIYKCKSLNSLMALIHSIAEKSTEEIENSNGIFQGEELSNLYHIIFGHTNSIILAVGDRISFLQVEEINKYKLNILIFFICAIIFIIIWSSSMTMTIYIFRRIFNMAICLIRRLPPSGLISNSELTNYLLYKKGEEIEMGVTHTIFNNSFDGIICMNLDGIVEIINKSFVTDYGYSTEQMVGQLIGTIFDKESRIKLENQLKLIKNHESNNYSDHVTCYTNDDRAIPSYITLFATKGDENSLILVVRDETILLQKKKRLELAKKQSQDLLEQIMPPKVLAMLKEGKSEISFVVPSATVMFVNIVNFSGFSADLSPQQIMGTLSTLFGAFDIWIQKYPLLTKIKLIGDSYMAASGLFAAEEDEVQIAHAKQCVDFAIHILNILSDTNLKLNTELQIRIGINSGGPIIAGVLGTENRVFDIIGDTINVASRLEHKSDPGHILISEPTYNLVKDFDYDITPKGEVFLKGKGDMKAYLI